MSYFALLRKQVVIEFPPNKDLCPSELWITNERGALVTVVIPPSQIIKINSQVYDVSFGLMFTFRFSCKLSTNINGIRVFDEMWLWHACAFIKIKKFGFLSKKTNQITTNKTKQKKQNKTKQNKNKQTNKKKTKTNKPNQTKNFRGGNHPSSDEGNCLAKSDNVNNDHGEQKSLYIVLLIPQYYCKFTCNRFSNCVLENGRPYFRPLDRGHIGCDLKWCGMDVHEATMSIIFLSWSREVSPACAWLILLVSIKPKEWLHIWFCNTYLEWIKVFLNHGMK